MARRIAKTDMNDATWIADLLAHGLIRASLSPRGAAGDLRALTRTRNWFASVRRAPEQRLARSALDAARTSLGAAAEGANRARSRESTVTGR
jgi:hypothetical protein